MIQDATSLAITLDSSEREALASLMVDERWAVVTKILEQGSSKLGLQCAASVREDPWLERGIWRGWLMFAHTLSMLTADVPPAEYDEEAAADGAIAGASSAGGYDFEG